MATDTGKCRRKGGKVAVSIRGFALPDDFLPDFRAPGYGVFFGRVVVVRIEKIADGFFALEAESFLVEVKQLYGFSRPICQPFDSAGNMKAQLGFAFRHERGERRRSLPLVLAAGFLLIAACDNVHPVQGMLRKTGLALQMGVMRACGVRCDALAAKGAKAVLLPDTVPPDGTAFKVGQMGIVLAGVRAVRYPW